MAEGLKCLNKEVQGHSEDGCEPLVVSDMSVTPRR